MLKMRRKQTAWGKEKPVKAAWWFGKPQRAFLFFNEQETVEYYHGTIQSGLGVCLQSKKQNARGVGGGGQHAKHLNHLCCMFFTITSELQVITRLILNL